TGIGLALKLDGFSCRDDTNFVFIGRAPVDKDYQQQVVVSIANRVVSNFAGFVLSIFQYHKMRVVEDASRSFEADAVLREIAPGLVGVPREPHRTSVLYIQQWMYGNCEPIRRDLPPVVCTLTSQNGNRRILFGKSAHFSTTHVRYIG